MKPPLTLSRATLQLERTRGYSPPYVTHQLVADLFPDDDERGYLYRVTGRAPGERSVLVLSGTEPTEGPERPWGTTRRLESKPYDPDLESGLHLDYELRLNATRVHTRTDDDGSKTKTRRDVWDVVFDENPETPRSPHDVYRSYVERKLEGAARIGEARVVDRSWVKAKRRSHRRPIQFVATNLIGTLKVQDPDALLETIAHGIGRAKAFGCGLLCLSRPGSVLARRYGNVAP